MKNKAIWSTLVAVVVISALGASAAQAQAQWVVKPAGSPGYIKEAPTEMFFNTRARGYSCNQSGASGLMSEKTFPAFVVAPTATCYSSARSVWHFNGCTEITTPTSEKAASFSINCPAGKQIELENVTEKCTIFVPAQTPTKQSVTLSQSGASIRAVHQVEGITYTSTGQGCGLSGTNGSMTFSSLYSGYKDAAFTKQWNIAIAESS